MIDILVLSTSSVKAINRNVYVEIKRRGWNIEMVIPTVYTLASGQQVKAEAGREEDPVIHLLELKGVNPRMFHFLKLKEVVDQRKPAIILIETDPVSFMAVEVGKLAKSRGIRLFSLSCENLSFDVLPTLRRRGISSLPSSLIKKYFFLSSSQTIDTVFTINEDGTRLFKEKGYSNVVKIPLGFDPAVFFQNEEARTRIRNQLGINIPVIAYFGRLVQEKGVHVLLQALAKLKDLEWKFMLDKFNQGTQAYNQQIYDLIQSLGLAERMTYIEADHFEIADYMNAADVVVIPSVASRTWKEQYGRVAPEAMACGKLVIVSDSGALPELVGEGGVVIKENDADEIARVLRDYLLHPAAYEHVRQNALHRAQQNLSLQQQANMYISQMKLNSN